jgi:hypothetical protein
MQQLATILISGSGTNKQDMVNSESQSVFKKRSFHGHHHPSLPSLSEQRSGAQWACPQWQAVVSLPCVRATKSREPDTPCLSRSAPRRDLTCKLKSAAVCVASPALSGSLVPRCSVGSIKSSSAPSLTYHPTRPRSGRSNFYDVGAGRTVVVCAQKSARLLDLDCPVPQDATGGRLCSG